MQVNFKSPLTTLNKPLLQEELDLWYIKLQNEGYFLLPQKSEMVFETQAALKNFSHAEQFIHIGIGGSALGSEMLISALAPEKRAQFICINNVDPDYLTVQLKSVRDWKKTLIYVVSKSGSTAETMATFLIVLNELKKNSISADKWSNHIVVCTDPIKSELKDFAQKYKLTALKLSSDVGGRFSVLTPVGLFPALWAGISIESLLLGAKKMADQVLNKNWSKNSFLPLAAELVSSHYQGKKQTVLMPYSSLLKDFSSWFVQLWAESLGKDGLGLTPIAAYGATDQHSQVQLFCQGPDDKNFLFVTVKKYAKDFSLKSDLDLASMKKLSPYTLSELIQAEAQGTMKAIRDTKRFVYEIELSELTSESLGGLILWLECLTSLVGHLLKVDPFNQPGVEAGKKYAWEWLEKGL